MSIALYCLRDTVPPAPIGQHYRYKLIKIYSRPPCVFIEKCMKKYYAGVQHAVVTNPRHRTCVKIVLFLTFPFSRRSVHHYNVLYPNVLFHRDNISTVIISVKTRTQIICRMLVFFFFYVACGKRRDGVVYAWRVCMAQTFFRINFNDTLWLFFFLYDNFLLHTIISHNNYDQMHNIINRPTNGIVILPKPEGDYYRYLYIFFIWINSRRPIIITITLGESRILYYVLYLCGSSISFFTH